MRFVVAALPLLVLLAGLLLLPTHSLSVPFSRPTLLRGAQRTSDESASPLPGASTPSPTLAFPTLLAPQHPIVGDNYTYCSLCELVTEYIAPLVRDGSTLKVIEPLAITYCVYQEYGKDCHSPSECVDLCTGVVEEFGPIVLNILANTSLSAQALCFDINLCPPPTPPTPGVPVPSNVSDMSGQKEWAMWRSTSGTGTFVHLSDLHFDTLYSPGSSTECGLDLCCRAAWSVPGNTSGVAGMFGDYQCDSPASLVHSTLAFINASLTPRPDFILYTGDDPAHDIWHQNRTTNLAAIAWVCAVLLQYFPDIPVLSAIGNHEVAPVNQFGGPGIDTWLYESLVLDWAYYLPTDAQQTLNYGGYYAALIRPGLYVLSINTNIYTSDDFYTQYNMVDLSNQLQWMNDTLYQIQQLGTARCIIIGHSSPVDWYDVFAQPFNAMLSRYRNIIMNTFFGHTHHNQVQLYTDDAASPAHTVGYIGGSVTPYTNVNPGIAVYSYDRSLQSSYLVSEIDYYWLNLTLANAQLSADWSGVKIRVSRDYGLPSLAPTDWWKLTETMAQGGAEKAFDLMQIAWYKGLSDGGHATVDDRKCFACSIEADTDALLAACGVRAGVNCTDSAQVASQQRADKCGSYSEEAVDAMRVKAKALEEMRAAWEHRTVTRADSRLSAAMQHRHSRRRPA